MGIFDLIDGARGRRRQCVVHENGVRHVICYVAAASYESKQIIMISLYFMMI